MDEFEALLEKVEKLIENTARKFYSIDGFDYEDLLQIGRIKVWEILTAKKVTEETFIEFKSYIATSLNNLFGNELTKSKAKKRINLRESVSLDESFNDDDDRSPYDFIPDKGGDITFETLEEIRLAALKTKDSKAIQGVVWCLVELLDISVEEAPKKINYYTFVEHGLGRYLWVFFNNSPFRAIRFAYSRFEPKDMKKRPNGYWKEAKGKRRALKELREILESSGYEKRDYPLIANHKFISDHGLRTPLDQMFNGSPFLFLSTAFPREFHPWMASVTPKNFFCEKKNIVKATRWLVEEILGFDIPNMNKCDIWRERVGKKIGKKDFEANGLRGLLDRFDNSPEKIIRLVYPGKFQEWDLGDKQKWSRPDSLTLAAEATRWVIEVHAQVSPKSDHIGWKFVIENGLHGMITSRKLGFNSSPQAVLANAYPKLFKGPS
mgnify:CR=1 FL=1